MMFGGPMMFPTIPDNLFAPATFEDVEEGVLHREP